MNKNEEGLKENREMLCESKRPGDRRLTIEKNWNHWKKSYLKKKEVP